MNYNKYCDDIRWTLLCPCSCPPEEGWVITVGAVLPKDWNVRNVKTTK